MGCVATATKPGMATPMCGLQTLTHRANIQMIFFFFYSLKCDFVALFGTVMFSYAVRCFLRCCFFIQTQFKGGNECACPLIARVCVPVGTARPGAPYSHFIPFSPTRLELHFVRVSSHLSMISNHWHLNNRSLHSTNMPVCTLKKFFGFCNNSWQ